MSLSLEVKKFINSEHTGEYIEIELPGELEVRRPRTKKAAPAPVPEAAEPADAESAGAPESGPEDTPGEDPLRSLCRKRSMNVRASTTLKRGRGNR